MSSTKSNGHKERLACSAFLTRSQALEQLERALESLQSGELHLQHGLQSLDFHVGEHVRLKIQAKRKGKQESVHISLEWERPDGNDRLVIAGTAPERTNQTAEDDEAGPNASGRKENQPNYEKWTREQLYERAQKLEIEGRSQMTKARLVSALQNH